MWISSLFSMGRIVPALLVLMSMVCSGQSRNMSGSWHLNVEKSRWGSTAKPFSVVIEIDHRDPAIEYRGAVTYVNEDTRTFGFSGAFDGKRYRMSRSFGDGDITLRRVDALTFDSTFRSDDGQFTEIARTSISTDGKILTRKLTVQSPEGKKSWTEIYEKH